MSAHHPAIVAAVTKKHIADAEAAAKAAGPRLTPEDAPWHDWAKDILAGEPMLTDDQRADAWDMFHSKNHLELAAQLNGQDRFPQDVVSALIEAKRRSTVVTPMDSVISAIHNMTTIPADVLDAAEQHPAVLNALVKAAHTKE